jgi:Asp-tRNA(Asn)/Glu-tRNA(Gln) amidotransferase A subunit family amidase
MVKQNVQTAIGENAMLSALDLASRIEQAELTPAAVVAACADAIAAREPEIQAFEALDVPAAKGRAEEAGAKLAALPLRGLPIGVKDIIDTVDFPTAYGTPVYAGHRPACDAALVSMLRRAGGIVMGKTATTPFAYLDPSKTRNPRNPQHTPGGSSSGSAAAVAAGMVPIALGTQTGGSIIRPAAYCGVAGFKPSFRLLPTSGIKCFSWSLDTAGVFAASVADAAFAAAAISGRTLRVDRDPLVPPRVGLVRTPEWDSASKDMQDAIERAARAAEGKGAQLTEIALPGIFEEAETAFVAIMGFEGWRAYAFEFDHHREKLPPLLRGLLERAATVTPEAYDDARRVTKRARRQLREVMAEVDVLLTPSAATAAPAGLNFLGAPGFNRFWTLMGTPCINVPGLVDAAGLPLGLQIIGRFARDQATLAAAAFVERAIG